MFEQNNPILTTVSTTALPIAKLKYPAITVCGQVNQYSGFHYNLPKRKAASSILDRLFSKTKEKYLRLLIFFILNKKILRMFYLTPEHFSLKQIFKLFIAPLNYLCQGMATDTLEKVLEEQFKTYLIQQGVDPEGQLGNTSFNKEQTQKDSKEHTSFNKEYTQKVSQEHTSFNKEQTQKGIQEHISFNKEQTQKVSQEHTLFNKEQTQKVSQEHTSFNEEQTQKVSQEHTSFNKEQTQKASQEHTSFNKKQAQKASQEHTSFKEEQTQKVN